MRLGIIGNRDIMEKHLFFTKKPAKIIKILAWLFYF